MYWYDERQPTRIDMLCSGKTSVKHPGSMRRVLVVALFKTLNTIIYTVITHICMSLIKLCIQK